MEYKLINENVKTILRQILTENIIGKIILNSISKQNIKNIICERLMKCVGKHSGINWNWSGISSNPNLTMEYIEKHPATTLYEIRTFYPSGKNWDWCEISHSANLTMEFVEKHPEIKWDWIGMSYNHNLTMEFVEKHPEIKWDWYGISQNPNVTMEYVEKHPEIKWDWNGNFNEPKYNNRICGKTSRNKLELERNFM